MRNRLAAILIVTFAVLACVAGLVSCRETQPTAPVRTAAKAGGATIATGQSYVRLQLRDQANYITDYIRLTIGYDANNNIGVVGHRLNGSTQFHHWNTVGDIWGYFDPAGPEEYLGEMYLHFVYINGVEDVNYTWALRSQQAFVAFYINGNGGWHPLNTITEITAFPEDADKPAPKSKDPDTVTP